MKVLITGAAGRVGSVVAGVLHRAGFELRLTDRKVRKDLPAKVEVLNLLDRDGVYRVMDECDALVHLGNHPHFGDGADAQTVFGENCQMNINVFQAARELGLKKVVFISSVQVIGGDRKYREGEPVKPSELKYLPLDGETPANPKNPYSLSKRAGEMLSEFYLATAGIETVALRLPWTCHPEWWGWMKKRRGDKVRDHHLMDEGFTCLHAEDAAELILAILKTPLPGYRQYFAAMPSPMVNIPIGELIERYYGGVELRKPLGEIKSFVDLSRITAETGWTPKHDLAETAE